VKGLFDGKGIFPGLPDREKSTNEPVALGASERIVPGSSLAVYSGRLE